MRKVATDDVFLIFSATRVYRIHSFVTLNSGHKMSESLFSKSADELLKRCCNVATRVSYHPQLRSIISLSIRVSVSVNLQQRLLSYLQPLQRILTSISLEFRPTILPRASLILKGLLKISMDSQDTSRRVQRR